MEITIITVGYRGDVQPYLALGQVIKDAGHAVLVRLPPDCGRAYPRSASHFGGINTSGESGRRKWASAHHLSREKKLIAARLTAAIKAVTGDDKIQNPAAAIGERIHAESGVVRAVEIISQYI
jgi:UDP:flavonoid glycosyltransferase YjiC (YdhE family)